MDIKMQIQRVQNNYNQTFGAKVTILDGDKIIPKGMKRIFTKLCRDLGKDTDEVCLMVGKGYFESGKQFLVDSVYHHKLFEKHGLLKGNGMKKFTEICKKVRP